MNTPAPLPNPLVSAVLFEDGELSLQFHGETRGVHEYLFDNPELMNGIAVTFRRAAVDSKLIRTGTATFAELAHHWGGIAADEEDDDDVLTYADFEQSLAQQETYDDD